MNELHRSILIMLVSVLAASIAQILLKLSALKEYPGHLRQYLNIHVITGYGLMLLSTVLTMVSLRVLPLSWSPLIESLSYVLVSVMGFFFLHEHMPPRKILGLCLILGGICLFSIA